MNSKNKLSHCKNNNLVYLLGLLFLFIYSGCRKPKTYRIPEELRRAVDFKEGSYFIFRDSVSGALDSFWVNEYTESMNSYNLPKEGDNEQYINIQFLDKDTNRIELIVSGYRQKITGSVVIKNMAIIPSTFFSVTKQANMDAELYEIRLLDFLDSITILGKHYEDVQIISSRNKNSSNQMISTMSSFSGLVRFVFVDLNSETRKTFELIEQFKQE